MRGSITKKLRRAAERVKVKDDKGVDRVLPARLLLQNQKTRVIVNAPESVRGIYRALKKAYKQGLIKVGAHGEIRNN